MNSTLQPLAAAPGAPAPRIRLLSETPDLAGHLARLGPLPGDARTLIAAAGDAGLTGRGGAAFPTAAKLAAVAARRGPKVAVANGTEGEPLSWKDKVLLTRSPHLVLDGLLVAARAVGAERRILCIERGRAEVAAAVRTALAERGDAGVELVVTPRRYLAGQESALVDLIDGGVGRPTTDRPFERGVGGLPTLVDNVETLAQLALIARFGPSWYRTSGTAADPGRSLITVSGAVSHPGVWEVPRGASVRKLLDRSGAVAPRAVLVGGYFGRWLPAVVAATLTLDAGSLASAGAALGCGVVAVVDEGSCAVAELARVAAWFAASSAGQCGSCTWGLRDLAAATAAIHGGTPDPAATADVRRWSALVRGRGACRLPDGAAAFLESGIEVFADEIAQHRAGTCTRSDRRLLPVPDPEPWS